jgi:hypothetical protein
VDELNPVTVDLPSPTSLRVRAAVGARLAGFVAAEAARVLRREGPLTAAAYVANMLEIFSHPVR